jgi:hypothetical protein
MKKKLRRYIFLAALLTMLFASSVNAGIVTYDTRAAFLTGLANLGYVDQQTLNFENQAAGSIIPNGGSADGVTFEYTISGDQIEVGNAFDTTSPGNYIGLNNAEGAFIYGDSFALKFDRTIHAVGLYIMAEPGAIFAGDFELSTAAGSLQNTGTPDVILSDGDAFFLGLIETDFNLGFSSATLAGLLDPSEVNYIFTVDDITSAVNPVPLPTTLLLLGTGLAALFGVRPKPKN